jgi:anti-anti-sigma factor
VNLWFSASQRIAVVTPQGELDLSRAALLRNALLRADEASELVVVDLAHVTFADSVSVGLLVGGLRRADRRGKRFVVANAGGTVLHALEMLGAVHFLVDTRRPLRGNRRAC